MIEWSGSLVHDEWWMNALRVRACVWRCCAAIIKTVVLRQYFISWVVVGGIRTWDPRPLCSRAKKGFRKLVAPKRGSML